MRVAVIVMVPGKKVRISRDVVFIEHEFGAPVVGMIMRDNSTGRFP